MSAEVRSATDKDLVAHAAVTINASKAEVWKALTTPETIKEFMYGAETKTDWQVGSPIVWKGEFKGKSFEDKGEILQFDGERRLQYSHYSPSAGDDIPENYHTVTYDLSESGGKTTVALTQDNNADEKAVENSTQMWQTMLESLKKTVES